MSKEIITNEPQDKPWWFPVVCDGAYFERLRKDYPENASMSDEELHEHYNNGQKYENLWDHTGDAYDQFEKLADDWIKLRTVVENIASQLTTDEGNREDTESEFGLSMEEVVAMAHDNFIVLARNTLSA